MDDKKKVYRRQLEKMQFQEPYFSILQLGLFEGKKKGISTFLPVTKILELPLVKCSVSRLDHLENYQVSFLSFSAVLCS